MFIDTFAQFEKLLAQVDDPAFGLTIDIGHVHCVEQGTIAGYLRQWSSRLFNVHIEDMCRGVHEHLRFGEGETTLRRSCRHWARSVIPGGSTSS